MFILLVHLKGVYSQKLLRAEYIIRFKK